MYVLSGLSLVLNSSSLPLSLNFTMDSIFSLARTEWISHRGSGDVLSRSLQQDSLTKKTRGKFWEETLTLKPTSTSSTSYWTPLLNTRDVVSVSTSRSRDGLETYQRLVSGLGPFRLVETFHAGAPNLTTILQWKPVGLPYALFRIVSGVHWDNALNALHAVSRWKQ